MTYAITLVKCTTGDRDRVLKILLGLKKKLEKKQDSQEAKIVIEKCYISFGWPDFVLILEGENVELLKAEILNIRKIVSTRKAGNLETSTIICTTMENIRNAELELDIK